MQTQEKYVLVTGAYGGMGRAVTAALAKNGYRVLAFDKTVGEGAAGVLPVEADITTEEGVARALEAVKGYTDSLFAILHFAGIYMLDSLVEMEAEQFRRILDVNFYGAFLINRAFLPMLSEGSRILITTSELAPLDPLPFTGIYAVTKGALEKYAYSLRMETNLLGIPVSIVRPGAVKTGLLGDSTKALDKFCDGTQLYACNAKRFKGIVDSVEARNVPPEKVAYTVHRALTAKRPKLVYKINRNPLLLLLNSLPDRLQIFLIGLILKP